MRRICAEVGGIQMANMLEGGETPFLAPEDLQAIGYRIAAYPLTLLSSAVKAMRGALADMRSGHHPNERLVGFAELREILGFEDYSREEERYR